MFRFVPDLEEINKMNEHLKSSMEEQPCFEDTGFSDALDEIRELRKDFEQYRSDQETKDIADKERQRVERRRSLIVSLIAGSLTGIVSGVFMYYWPDILALFISAFQ